MTTLEATDLTFGYARHVVGTAGRVSVAPGEVVCLLGPNGSGKTTLFKTLLGLVPRLSGRIMLDGTQIESLSRRAVAQRVAYVPQAHAGVFPYTVRDVVLMGRTAHRGLFAGPGAADRARVDRVLDDLDIRHLADRDYTRISGGQRQLALIARALAQETRLVVMDEPTASLDYGNQVMVLDAVRRLSASGYGIVLSTHDPDHAFQVASRVVMLADGAIQADGAPESVLTSERLSQTYGVAIAVEMLANGARVCVPVNAAAHGGSRAPST